VIAFCARCWAEVDSEERQCSNCGADFGDDTRSYEEKLIAALGHPLPAVAWSPSSIPFLKDAGEFREAEAGF
jgi:DNA-directed RNA polymerase subunit RPC12/RpoP